jgi:hypothetical protein
MPKECNDQLEDTTDDEPPPSKAPLATMTDRLRLLATRSEEMWWEIGVLLDEIAARGLVPLSFDDFAAFAATEVGLPKADALRFRRVSHHFSREMAMRFGAARLDMLLQYLDAAPSAHYALDLLRIEVIVRIDGEDVAVLFSEISDEDLAHAVRSAKRRRTTSDPSIPPDVAAERDRLADALAGEAPDVRVKVHHTAGGVDDYSLSLTGIDPFNMAAVGKVLLAEGKVLAKAEKQR